MSKMTKVFSALALGLILAISSYGQVNQLGPVSLVVAPSATPVFNASVANVFYNQLTANVTSSTLSNGYAGEIVQFVIQQDGTGSRTFVWPTNVGGAPNVLAAANAITYFTARYDGIAWQAYGPVAVQQIAAYSNATTSFTSIPEIGFSVAANRNYKVYCSLTWSTANTASAPKYQFTGPGSPTAVLLSLDSPLTVSTISLPAAATAFSSAIANAATVTTATNFTDIVTLSVQNGANAGVIQLQAAATAANAVTWQPGSGCVLYAQ